MMKHRCHRCFNRVFFLTRWFGARRRCYRCDNNTDDFCLKCRHVLDKTAREQQKKEFIRRHVDQDRINNHELVDIMKKLS